jgi:DNA-directed RNA polymerase specialized sigma24 family protein
MSELKDDEFIKELKLTNRLLAQILIRDKDSKTERVGLLERCGFPPSEIADLLNMKLNVVTATLSNIRKAESKKQKPKGG